MSQVIIVLWTCDTVLLKKALLPVSEFICAYCRGLSSKPMQASNITDVIMSCT